LTFLSVFASIPGAWGRHSNDKDQGTSLTVDENDTIKQKIIHDCIEKIFWSPERQTPLQCAGRTVEATAAFKPKLEIPNDPIVLVEFSNIAVVIPETLTGYRFARLRPGVIEFKGYLGPSASQAGLERQEPFVGSYWERVQHLFPEYFSSSTAELWKLAISFPEAEQVGFGQLDEWKKQELSQIESAIKEGIGRERASFWKKQYDAHPENLRYVTLQIADFSKWSGGTTILIPELHIMWEIYFHGPLGSVYEADLGRDFRLEKARGELIQRIRTHGFHRKISVSFETGPTAGGPEATR
jgi:hypothetical protein